MADFTTNSQTSTAALEYLVGKTVDTVLSYSPATLFFLGQQKRWQGTQLRIPIKYQQNTQGTQFDGLQRFSNIKTNNFVNMTFSPTGREIPTVISQMEVDVADPTKVIDIIARQMASDAQDLADDIATQFWTLQTGINFLSILDGVDDTTLGANNYGGLARSTYTGLKGNLTATVGNLTLPTLRTSYNNASHGFDTPNLILTTKAVFSYIEKLATPVVQFNVNTAGGYASFLGATKNGLPNIAAPGSKVSANLGFNSIYWNGVPVVADEKVPTGYLVMLNTRSWAFYGLESKRPGYKAVKFASDSLDSVYNVPVTTGFAFSGFTGPIDQYGDVGHTILMGNLICENPRLNAIETGITGA